VKRERILKNEKKSKRKEWWKIVGKKDNDEK
jgi:hypothetical protein